MIDLVVGVVVKLVERVDVVGGRVENVGVLGMGGEGGEGGRG